MVPVEQRGLRRVACLAGLALLLALLGLVAPAAAGGSPLGERAGQSDVVGGHAAVDRGTVRAAHLVSPGPADLLADAPAGPAVHRAAAGHRAGPEPAGAAGELDPSIRGSRAPPAFVS